MPKIAEINTICREIGRDNVYYEPEIETEVLSDGRKISRVVIRVYADRNNKDSSGIVPMEIFQDKVYFDVKDLYEEAEEKGFPSNHHTENDGETFGWALADSWHHVGNVYYFMLSLFNLIETTKDNSPIIDTKGSIQGNLQYSCSFELYDVDRTTKLNPLEYESLNELIGKNIKVVLELRKAMDIPEKYTYKTQCKYIWSDVGFETLVVENNKDPNFNYRFDHMQVITEDLI